MTRYFFSGIIFIWLFLLSAGGEALAGNDAPLPDDSLYQTTSRWIDQTGEMRELQSFRGKPVVLTMFYAHCLAACPVTIDVMRQIDEKLGATRDRVQFVLVTFDSARDNVETLHAYSKKRDLPAPHYRLLRGEIDDTLELAVLLGIKFKKMPDGEFSHSNVVIVLDSEGRIVKSFPAVQDSVADAAKTVLDLP